MHRLARLACLVLALLFAGSALPSSGQTVGAPASAPAAAPAAPAPALTPEQAAKALIEVLDNEEARTRLIGELGRIAAKGVPAPSAGAPAAAPADEPDTLARTLGLYTESIARDFTEIVKRIWIRLSHLATVLTGAAVVNWTVLQQHLTALLLVGGLAFGALWIARFVAGWPLRRLDALAVGRSPAVKLLLNVVVLLVQLVCLAVATAVAYLAIAALEGQSDVVANNFANAFTLIETIKIAIRLIFQPRRSELRLFPISTPSARYWAFWFARLAELLGYGIILGVPIITAAVSFAVALGFRMLVAILALLGFSALVILNRKKVRAGLMDAASRTSSVAITTAISLIAPVWHVLAVAYAVVAFAIWITRPLDAIGFMVTATAQSAIIIAGGGAVMALFSRAIEGGVRLPADVRSALPLLESRLNLLVPTVLRLLRIAMGALMAAGVLQAWQIIDVFGWAETDSGSEIVSRIFAAGVILLIATAIWIAATSWIEYRLRPTAGRVSTPRARTLLQLFRNALTILISIIGVMLALSELGVDIAPLIAGAGVFGLAIGFGSQKLVQDIITGAFIQFENAMNEGDVVTVAGISGAVEKLTIRSVGLRDGNGVYHVIPFSSVDLVSNAMRGFAYHVADIKVSIGEDIDEVKRLMGTAFDRLMQSDHQAEILEPLEMNGIVSFVDGAVVVRARIKTLPGKQWGVGRAYNELVKTAFDEARVNLAVPASSVVIREVRPPPAPRPVPETAAAKAAEA